jgi:hypothetical protein
MNRGPDRECPLAVVASGRSMARSCDSPGWHDQLLGRSFHAAGQPARAYIGGRSWCPWGRRARRHPYRGNRHHQQEPPRLDDRAAARLLHPGQMTYDLRRLRLTGLIERIERTHAYVLTPTASSSPSSTPSSTTGCSAPSWPPTRPLSLIADGRRLAPGSAGCCGRHLEA